MKFLLLRYKNCRTKSTASAFITGNTKLMELVLDAFSPIDEIGTKIVSN